MTSGVKQTVIRNPTWWKRRTSMERGLTLLSGIALVVALSLIIALCTVLYQRPGQGELKNVSHMAEAYVNAKVPLSTSNLGQNSYQDTAKKPLNNDDLCLTAGCIQTAAKVLESMDPNVDPCDDFYQFACGNFVKNTNIPDDKSAVTVFSTMSEQLQEQLRTMIEEPVQENEPKPFKLVKRLYKTCMNKSAIEADGYKTINAIFKKLGGWPVLEGDNWRDGDFNWQQAVYRFRRVGYSIDYFMDFSVGIDLKNSTRRIIDLDQAALSLRREFLVKGLEDKLVKALYDYMVDIAVLFGAQRDRAMKELKESLEFEIGLANISLPNEKRRNATALYNPMTVEELEIKFPSIPWTEYINTLLAPDTQITRTETVIVSVPDYLTNFEKLIAKTPKRVQANYLLWRAAASSVSYLTEELRNRQLQYSTIVTGKTERASRWKECIDVSAGGLSIASGALYVRKYFNEEARQSALDMVADIQAEFKEIVKNVDWMDEKTRRSALEKADSMVTHIAYPDELLDNRKLEEFYEDLDFDMNANYLRSILNLTLFGTRYSLKRLRQPVNKTEWITHGRPAIVNAFYSSIENSIQFPAGILQGVFFNNDRPKYMNYGAIGFVIGHEITHGFDDQGRQFDKEGNLVDWWAPETQEAFIKKAQCIIEQYGNYTVPEIGINLNGINTQGENIADNGGIKQAYLAYANWAKKMTKSRSTVAATKGPDEEFEEARLPGLQMYSPSQMFWISAANNWCAKYRPESLKLRVLTGQHSPGYFRILGPLSNSPEFARDFNCPSGTKMNPKQKCTVW